MKRLICLSLILICVLSGCKKDAVNRSDARLTGSQGGKIGINSGVWLSYLEINTLLKSQQGFKKEFNSVAEKLYAYGIKELYFHLRSHCDSMVNSDLFPKNDNAKSVDYDILDYVISVCHQKGIKVHGWINPYRVTASHSDIEKLPTDSPAVKWLRDSDTHNDRNVIIMNGIYLNPAEAEVRKLVVDGIRELMARYDLDGIHFDDYFYPTDDPSFDSISYEEYKSGTKNPLSQENWRRENVNILITAAGAAIRSSGKNMIFSISPAANIEKNYNSSFADVKYWAQAGLVDEIIPQLYFGFNHTSAYFKFPNLLNEWLRLSENSKASLKIGLAPYKIGTVSQPDGDEWQTNSDILARQIALCRQNPEINGVVFYSYTSLFSGEEQNTAERNNMLIK